jgi:hypothetical protein
MATRGGGGGICYPQRQNERDARPLPAVQLAGPCFICWPCAMRSVLALALGLELRNLDRVRTQPTTWVVWR